jgi:hypothetical protein
MTELTDVPGAFGYGDSILVGERVRLRGVRDNDLPALARWEMDPGRLITLSNWVAPPSQAAARESAGMRAYQKAGFTVEGRQRESVLHDGRWYDSVLMSILDHEWAARRPACGGIELHQELPPGRSASSLAKTDRDFATPGHPGGPVPMTSEATYWSHGDVKSVPSGWEKPR